MALLLRGRAVRALLGRATVHAHRPRQWHGAARLAQATPPAEPDPARDTDNANVEQHDSAPRAPQPLPSLDALADLCRPHFRNGRWIPPQVNNRRLARLRKMAYAEGLDWPERPLRKEARPTKPKKHVIRKQARLLKIEDNMKKMPRLVEEYRRKRYETRRQALVGKEVLPAFSQPVYVEHEDEGKGQGKGKGKGNKKSKE